MVGAPARFDEFSDGRADRLDAKLTDLEQRLKTLQLEDERLRSVEQSLLDASARRIHEFERRLEHEWLALRQLHEESLKHPGPQAAAIDTSLNLVREALELLHSRGAEPIAATAVDLPQTFATRPYSRAAIIFVVVALAALAFFGYRLERRLTDIDARTAAADERTSQLQQRLTKQSQELEQTVEHLTGEALTTAARAERLANVLAASDVLTYPLHGQRTAAAAEGHVFFSSSRGVVMTASHLPPAPADQIYQVWATTTRGPVSLGFASPDARGRASAAFDPPPELLPGLIGFMLTVEPARGSLKPTGPTVLAS
jgi:hypothetical protein